MSYAEQIQARERARGEEIVKNNAKEQAKMGTRSGQYGNSATVESNGMGFSGSNSKRQMSYAEQIQARERARGEELVKNNAKEQAKMGTRSSPGGMYGSSTVESNGKGFAGSSGRRQLSYAEEIQARERARGEQIVKNNAKEQASTGSGRSQVAGASYSGSDDDNREYDSPSPHHVNTDLSEHSADANVKADLDQMRRDELMKVMKDRSLSKEEKALKMKEIRAKYA